MTGPEEQPIPSPEVPFGEKVSAFDQAGENLASLIDFGPEPESDRWGSEVSEEQQEVAKDFYRALLGLKEEGEWESAEEALDEERGIRFSEEDERKRTQRLVDFLGRQGITEEILKEADQEEPQSSQEAEQPETPQATPNPEAQEGGQPEEGQEENQQEASKEKPEPERITIRRLRRRRRPRGRMTPEEEALLAAEGARPEEEIELRATDYYERMRQRAIRELREVAAFDDDNLEHLLEEEEKRGPNDIDLEQPVKTTRFEDIREKEKRGERRRQQYLALTAAEAIKSSSYIERQKLFFLAADDDLNSPEASILKAAEFVQKSQAAATGTTKVEQTEQTIGNPGPEVFSGLRMLTVRVEVKTEDGKEYKGDISPLHMMDLMDNPRWCYRLMTNRFDAGDTDPGYFDLGVELMKELFCQRLKDSEGSNLPEDAKITWSNLYSFGLRRRIDKKVEQEKREKSVTPINEKEEEVEYEITGKKRENVRDLILGDLWWLHDAAWYIFCVGGRQRAWDKALEGRWQLPQMRKPLLPTSFDGIKYNQELWARRRFFRIIMWYDFWSEQAEYILPLFRAEMDNKQKDIILRKALRRGALPHLELEESKIALGLGEYQEGDWSGKAQDWLNKQENITLKGEMKAFSEMQNVAWKDGEREAIQDVDFRPALERMRQFDPGVKIEGNTKGVEGYQKVVSQLSYQNLDYSAIEEKAWLSQMSYTTAANQSFDVLRQFFQGLVQPSTFGVWPPQEKEGTDGYWRYIEGIKSSTKEAMRQLANSIAYVSPAERTEAGTELLHAIAQTSTFYQRNWIVRLKRPKPGQWEEGYVVAEQIPQDRRETLKRLGYQFIRISEGKERVFGPSGAPVRRLVNCSRQGHYFCPARHQLRSRPLGWRFISSLGNAALQIGLIGDAEAKAKAMEEIKSRVPDEWPSLLPGDEHIGSAKKGKDKWPFIKDEQFVTKDY